MGSFRHQQRERIRLRCSKMGLASQRIQRARRMAEMTPEILMDLTANPTYSEGDSLGSITWHNHRTGRVTRWIVERGPRLNNYRLRSPDGRKSKPHGMSWLIEKIRAVILMR